MRTAIGDALETALGWRTDSVAFAILAALLVLIAVALPVQSTNVRFAAGTAGTLTKEGRDIAERLVREGHAAAACGDRYKAEEHAKRDARGMWGQSKCFDPRFWRHRKEARK